MKNSKRYQRQIMLPEIGEAGQEKLADSRVMIVGMGGLGCPVSLYLNSVGIGYLTLVDHDKVEISNLHRQVLYGDHDIGRFKAIRAKEYLLNLASGSEIEAITEPLSQLNAFELVNRHDFVLDCSDNFRTRYLLSDACVLAKKPLISAAISRFDAEIAFLCDQDLPCYRCLFPDFTALGKIQNCAEAGVLGSFVGMVGALQANELVKAIVGLSRLKGKLLCYQGLDNEMQQYTIEKNMQCVGCASSLSPQSAEANDGWPLALPNDFRKPDFSTNRLKEEDLLEVLSMDQDRIVIDVRERHEYRQQHIRGAHHFPLSKLLTLPEEWKNQELIVYCLSGHRSKQALEVLRERGFAKLSHIEGGISSLHSPESKQFLSVWS